MKGIILNFQQISNLKFMYILELVMKRRYVFDIKVELGKDEKHYS